MRAAFRFVVVACAVGALSLAACSSEDDNDDVDDDPLKWSFETGDFEVPEGDSFTCFYTDKITDRELAVVNATGTQFDGGHHVTVYYTDIQREPQYHECDDAEMADWRQIAGTAATNELDLSLPEGLGLRVPEGKQIVLQAHYINLSGAPMTVNDNITLHLAEPSTLEAFVSDFVMLDASFNVPAHEEFESVTTCTVPEDLNLVILLGHLHEWGDYYQLERIDEEGNTLDVLYEEQWDPSYSSSPPVARYPKDDPLVLSQGTRLRQTCRWTNIEDYNLIFPREMCLAWGLFYPEQDRVLCEMD